MKRFLKENKTIISLVLIAVIFILMNLSVDSSFEVKLKGTEDKTGKVTYLPAVYLNEGNYWFYLSAEGKGDVEFSLVSGEHGEVFKGTILGGTGRYYDISLEHDMTNLKFVTGASDVVLKKVKMSSYGIFYTDTYFVAFFAALLGAMLIFMKNMKDKEKRGIYAFLFASAVISSYLLFNFSVYSGHDIYFHLYRIEGIKEGILCGQFPVRVHPPHNNGYGYITASVYPELFLYFPAIMRILGASLPFAYKTFIFAINLTTVFVMYYSAKTITKSRYSALLAAVIYTLSTWRLMNVYARAALGEMLALAFLPLILAGLYQIICGDRKKWYILAIGCTCIAQAHIISTLLCAIICIIFGLCFIVKIFREKRWIEILKAGTLTLLLNLWFFVPFMRYYFGLDMLINRQITQKTPFYDNAIPPAKLFDVFNQGSGWALSMGFSVSVLLVVLVAFYLFSGKADEIKDKKFKKVSLITLLVFLFAATTLFPWERLQDFRIINNFGHIIQFPWRFLTVVTVFVVILSGEILQKYINKDKRAACLVCVFFVCTIFALNFGAEFTQTENIALKQGYAAPDVQSTIGYDKEYLLVGTKSENLTPNRYVSYNTSVTSFEKDGTNLTFYAYGSGKSRYVEVPLLYYPGYRAVLNGEKELPALRGANNVMRIILGTESGKVEIRYIGFWYFRLAEAISLVTLIIFIFSLIKLPKKDKVTIQGEKNE